MHFTIPWSSSPSLLALLLVLLLVQGDDPNRHKPKTFFIGGVLSSAVTAQAFTQEAQDIDYRKKYLPANVSLYDSTQIMDSNPIKTAITVCDKLIKEQVYAIIVSKPENGELSPASVSYTAGFYHIPVLGISSRDSAFSDKNIHVSFLRTVPPYSHQADVWVELLKHFQYRQLVFIHSSDTDGRALLGRFQTKTQDLVADDQEVKVEKIVEFEPGKPDYENVLLDLKLCQARVYFLYATKEDASKIFVDAKKQNMTGKGYVWIVTEQALESENIPDGALGLQLNSSANEEAHIHDSLHILAAAIGRLYKEEAEIEAAPSNCNSSGSTWNTGKKLFKYIREQQFNEGKTGRVAFDSMGDRVFAEYKVINIQTAAKNNKVKKVEVGTYSFSAVDDMNMTLSIADGKIIWPGGLKEKPTGVMIPTHLKVLTIVERPFVYHKDSLDPEGKDCDNNKGWYHCPEYLIPTQQSIEQPGESLGEHGENQTVGGNFCCRGYCIDLLERLSKKCNFTYELSLSFENYGEHLKNNVTGKLQWTGLIGELVAERADLIVAPLTINPERATVMEFSKPFKYQGITILQKRQPRASQLVSFLQPFKYTLWVLVLVSVKVIAICLYLLDRFSPFGRYTFDPPETVKQEESLNLTSAIWFAWGVLLNSGIGEGTPRSFSARVLGMVWAGFAMIIVASYTANLAAFLVLDKPQTSLTGINDPRLRNPMENFTYATVKASSVDMYFRRQVELSNMYRTMEGKHYKDAESAIAAVENGSLKAFIWDSSRLEFEAARKCELITAGELFGRSGYGVGLQKGSPWADKITLAILDFHESGTMEELDNDWILDNDNPEVNCRENDNNSPATLGLDNMQGVFVLVGAGIIGGSVLILVEIIYHKHNMRKAKRNEAAKVAINRWKGTVEARLDLNSSWIFNYKRRKTIREGKEAQKKLRPNGISGSGGTTDSLALSVESLPKKSIYPSQSKWSKLNEHVRSCSAMSDNCRLRTSPATRRRIPPSSSIQRSLPSSEFLRIASSNEQLNSPITPLSFDFGRKKRKRLRPDSPDMLQDQDRSLVPFRGARDSRDSRDDCPPSPDFSGSDYAPGRGAGSAESVCYGQRGSQESLCYVPVSTDRWVEPSSLPRPPPPPKKRLGSPPALLQRLGSPPSLLHGDAPPYPLGGHTVLDVPPYPLGGHSVRRQDSDAPSYPLGGHIVRRSDSDSTGPHNGL